MDDKARQNTGRTLVLGDCHGAHLALEQCLDRCNFDYDKDTLISLGDICDGWPFVKETVQTLQGIKNFLLIIGNHDKWAIEWAEFGEEPFIWTSQGGEATLQSFHHDRQKFPLEWFKNGSILYESYGQVFVHGGIDPNQLNLNKQNPDFCMWDRDLLQNARIKHASKPNFKYGGWKDIFVGHTTTQVFGTLKPVNFCNVWGIDTGGGWNGKLTIMDADTKEYWQSDLVPTLYPDIPGRV